MRQINEIVPPVTFVTNRQTCFCDSYDNVIKLSSLASKLDRIFFHLRLRPSTFNMRTPTTIRSNSFKFLAASALLLLGACAQTSTQHHYSDTQIQQSQASLQVVRDSYNNGNYSDVITR